MNSDWEKFQVAYKVAPQAVKDFVDSDKILLFIDNLISIYDLPSSVRGPLVITAVDMALKIYQDDAIITFLNQSGIAGNAISLLLSDITKFVSFNVSKKIAEAGATPLIQSSVAPQPIETTYTSTQAAILTERPSPPPPQAGGRWETDR